MPIASCCVFDPNGSNHLSSSCEPIINQPTYKLHELALFAHELVFGRPRHPYIYKEPSQFIPRQPLKLFVRLVLVKS